MVNGRLFYFASKVETTVPFKKSDKTDNDEEEVKDQWG